jgi:hypothetical protein
LGNLAPKTPIRVGDRTRIGGVTKSFTATVVLQLVGEGKLALDDTVEQWLPGVIPNGAAISVRQLLNHTSGMFDYAKDPRVLGPYFEDFPNNLTMIFDPHEGVRIAAEHGPQFAPGTGWSYSNTNYPPRDDRGRCCRDTCSNPSCSRRCKRSTRSPPIPRAPSTRASSAAAGVSGSYGRPSRAETRGDTTRRPPGYMIAAWSSQDATRQVVVIVNTNVDHDEPVAAAMRNVLITAYCGD